MGSFRVGFVADIELTGADTPYRFREDIRKIEGNDRVPIHDDVAFPTDRPKYVHADEGVEHEIGVEDVPGDGRNSIGVEDVPGDGRNTEFMREIRGTGGIQNSS